MIVFVFVLVLVLVFEDVCVCVWDYSVTAKLTHARIAFAGDEKLP